MEELTDMQKRFLAAYLDTLNASHAAREAGYAYPKQAGYKLLNNPTIARTISEHLDELREKGSANRAVRISKLNAMEEQLEMVQFARAVEAQARLAEGEELPAGADSGLLVETKKTFGSGRTATVESVWEIDKTLVEGRMKLLEQIARETGDRDRRLVELTGRDGGPLQVESAATKLEAFLDEES